MCVCVASTIRILDKICRHGLSPDVVRGQACHVSRSHTPHNPWRELKSARQPDRSVGPQDSPASAHRPFEAQQVETAARDEHSLLIIMWSLSIVRQWIGPDLARAHHSPS